ncbi:MAG: type II toxin-antitoxin system VapC family toxin [Rhizobiaceae bacterium]
MNFVLDSTALLAVICDEAGAENVAATLPNAMVSAVNMVEVIARLIDLRHSPAKAQAIFEALPLDVVPFEADQATLAGRLREDTRHLGLSLGDRACLATAIERGATVLTADRAWAGLDVGCPIQLIR